MATNLRAAVEVVVVEQDDPGAEVEHVPGGARRVVDDLRLGGALGTEGLEDEHEVRVGQALDAWH
jgi:hypothetical protein